MGRFTKSILETQRLTSVLKMLFESGFCVKVTLNDGSVIEGHISKDSVGNDFNGHNFNSFTIRKSDGTETTVDALDVKFVTKGNCD